MFGLPILDENSQTSLASAALASASKAHPISGEVSSLSPVLLPASFIGTDGEILSDNKCNVKRMKVAPDDVRLDLSPPGSGMRRSQSEVVTLSMEESFASPKRSASFVSGSRCQSKARSGKVVLRRSQSFTFPCKALDFDEEHHDSLYLRRGDASTTSERSSSSLSTMTDLSIGQSAATFNLHKWEESQLKRQRPASTTALDEEPPRKTYASSLVLTQLTYGMNTAQRSVSECAMKLSGLDMSHEGSDASEIGRSALFNRGSLDDSGLFGESPRASPEHQSDSDEWTFGNESAAAAHALPAPSSHHFSVPPLPSHFQPVFAHSHFETPTREQLYIQQCRNIDLTGVISMCQEKVKVVILDLDRTLLSIHTDGEWTKSAKDLGETVRPVFQVMIEGLLKAELPIGIATFSTQESLIEDMLVQVFGDAVRIGENVFVRGSRSGEPLMYSQPDEEEEEQLVHGFASQKDQEEGDTGKRKHIQSILEMIGADVSANQILFVDDDSRNVSYARKDKHRVVHFKEHCSENAFLNDCCFALED